MAIRAPDGANNVSVKGKTPAGSFSNVTAWDLCLVARSFKCFTSNASKVFCSDQPRPKNIEKVNKLFLDFQPGTC